MSNTFFESGGKCPPLLIRGISVSPTPVSPTPISPTSISPTPVSPTLNCQVCPVSLTLKIFAHCHLLRGF